MLKLKVFVKIYFHSDHFHSNPFILCSYCTVLFLVFVPWIHYSCASRLYSLEGDRILAAVWLAVPDQEAGLSAGLQLELRLLASHTAMVPAETQRGRKEDYNPPAAERGRRTSFHINPMEKSITLKGTVHPKTKKCIFFLLPMVLFVHWAYARLIPAVKIELDHVFCSFVYELFFYVSPHVLKDVG